MADLEPTLPPPTKPKGNKRFVIIALALLGAGGGLAYYLYDRQFEDTDDAQIDGDITNVSSRVPGTVTAVYVSENDVVKAGDKLIDIDPRDLQVATLEARARVSLAESELKAQDPSIDITSTSNQSAVASARSDESSAQAVLAAARKEVDQLGSQLAQAEANDKNAQLEKERATRLVAEGAVSQAEADLRTNAANASAAQVEGLRHALAGAKDGVAQQQARLASAQSRAKEVADNAPRQLETSKATVTVRQANLEVAKAQLAEAELNETYCKIVAPAAGIVGKKAVAVGERVAVGQQLLAIAQVGDLWVTANFRETQLKRLRVGQKAVVHVDALGLDLRGTIETIGGATGSRFSVLPPENATGNYVKVVQRIPVRIRLAPDQAGLGSLRPGMSVEPKVTVR